MQTKGEIRAMLEERGLAPRKSLGQNFLIEKNLILKLVDASGVGEGDLVLEVGPGTGTLTEALLDLGARVVASELDTGLSELLRERLGDRAGFTLVEGDCLARKSALADALVEALGEAPFRLVANLPYAAATPLMMTLIASHPACLGMWVTVQFEVSERLGADAGTKAYGPISIVAQAACEVTQIAKLGAGCFWPEPGVKSAMVGLRRRETAMCGDLAALADLSKKLFMKRRKVVRGVVDGDALSRVGLAGDRRVESLTVSEVCALCDAGVIV